MAAKSNLTNMVLCLTAVCMVCSALLGGMYVLTAEPIAKANADILKASIGAVLPEGGELSEAKALEVGGQASEYYVSTSGDAVQAYAIKSTTVGFGGPLTLMVGITPDGKVYNTSVLSHTEEPSVPQTSTSTPSSRALILQRRSFLSRKTVGTLTQSPLRQLLRGHIPSQSRMPSKLSRP